MKPELELVRGGRITPEQYVEAISRQAEETTPLGQVAIEAGLLTAREIFEVLHRQRTDRHKRFGDIAVELGYLNRSQVALLLLEQLERRRPVLEHLREMGVLDDEAAPDASRPEPSLTPAEPLLINASVAAGELAMA